jgi:hypothetical protein
MISQSEMAEDARDEQRSRDWQIRVNTSRFVGIDPGGTGGGLAVIHGTSPLTYDAVPMPTTPRDIVDWLHQWAGPSTWCFIEDVHAFPGQGVTSVFSFGQNYGELRGAVSALSKLTGMRWQTIGPKEWQSVLKLRKKTKEETQTEWKNYLKGVAQQSFPLTKVTLKTADALLIAEFCRRKKTARMVGTAHEL